MNISEVFNDVEVIPPLNNEKDVMEVVKEEENITTDVNRVYKGNVKEIMKNVCHIEKPVAKKKTC